MRGVVLTSIRLLELDPREVTQAPRSLVGVDPGQGPQMGVAVTVFHKKGTRNSELCDQVRQAEPWPSIRDEVATGRRALFTRARSELPWAKSGRMA